MWLSMTLSDYANEAPPSAKLSALSSYMQEEDPWAPIDMYRSSISAILQYGTEERLRESLFLGRLLALGLVSAVEGYCRAVLSNCMEICPVSQAVSAEKMINLGGLLWHGKAGFSKSAFEHTSFSSKKELVTAFRDYIGFRLSPGVFESPLDEYDDVCQLRHGIVHGDGLLPGRNAVRLNIPRFEKPARIILRYRHLQEIASVVNTLVFSLNRELFEEMCKRWATDWRERADWNPALEDVSFSRLWEIFRSEKAPGNTSAPSEVVRANCMSETKTRFDLLR